VPTKPKTHTRSGILKNTLIVFAFMLVVALGVYLVANPAGWIAGYNQGWNDGVIRPFDFSRISNSFGVLFTDLANLITMVITLVVLFALSLLAALLITPKLPIVHTP